MNDADANQTYGALTEGFYLASFTFERAMSRTLALLKKDEWRKVGDGFDDVNDFVRSLRLDRFKVLAEQRRDFVDRVKALQPAVSNRAIADALGVSRMTVNRDTGTNVPPDGREPRENGEAAGTNAPPGAAGGKHDAARINQRDTREERREEKLNSIAKAAKLTGQFSVVYADPPWEFEV